MSFVLFRDARDGKVAISCESNETKCVAKAEHRFFLSLLTNRFNFEYTESSCDTIELSVQSFQKLKYLNWLAGRTPFRES